MRWKNILHLGVKELWSLVRDPIMLVLDRLRLHANDLSSLNRLAGFAAQSTDQHCGRGPIAAFSNASSNAFQPPWFNPPTLVSRAEMDTRMDAGKDTFALDIRPNFQQDVLAGRSPAIQLNTDATRVGQAFIGSAYIQTIVTQEVQTWVQRYRDYFQPPVDLAGAGALQRQPQPVLVRRDRGTDRPDHDSFSLAHRFCPHSRARARDGRALVRHAGDAVRDHDEQDLVDGNRRADNLRDFDGLGRRGCVGRSY